MEKKRKLLIINFAVLAIAALLYAALVSPEGVMTMAGSRRYPIYRGSSQSAVSIRCGLSWDAKSVSSILDTLDEYGVSITFAVSSDWAEAHPTLLCDIASRGHEIAAMSGHASGGSPREISEDLSRTLDAIERITGERPKLFCCGREGASASA